MYLAEALFSRQKSVACFMSFCLFLKFKEQGLQVGGVQSKLELRFLFKLYFLSLIHHVVSREGEVLSKWVTESASLGNNELQAFKLLF